MGFFEDIQREAQARKLQFLIIGGHAVNFHGVSRETADLDLLICREDRLSWVEALRELGYGTFTERPNFMQFTAPENTGWPVDLMFVNRETLYRMFDAGLDVRMFDCLVRIPCLEHLLALKLHALKYSHVGRYAKDLLDVESLVRKNKLDLRSEKVREIFLKHGTVNIYEQISRFTAGGER